MNIKQFLFAAMAIVSGVAFATGTPNRSERLAKLGGFVDYPNSQKGSVAIINTQDKVDISKPLNVIFSFFKNVVPVKVDILKMSAGRPEELKAKSGAKYVVVVVNDPAQPTSIVAQEEGYAVVNVAKYTANLKFPDDNEIYATRCARGVMKAFVLMCGGGGSRYPATVAATHNARELDTAQDKIPIDTQDSIRKFLEGAGVTPLKRTIYRKACQEGWAPNPTNDVQKKIWDEIHAIPTKPIKIEFDPKRDAGK